MAEETYIKKKNLLNVFRFAFNQREKQIIWMGTRNYLPAGLIKRVQKRWLALHKASESRAFGFPRLWTAKQTHTYKTKAGHEWIIACNCFLLAGMIPERQLWQSDRAEIRLFFFNPRLSLLCAVQHCYACLDPILQKVLNIPQAKLWNWITWPNLNLVVHNFRKSKACPDSKVVSWEK